MPDDLLIPNSASYILCSYLIQHHVFFAHTWFSIMYSLLIPDSVSYILCSYLIQHHVFFALTWFSIMYSCQSTNISKYLIVILYILPVSLKDRWMPQLVSQFLFQNFHSLHQRFLANIYFLESQQKMCK